MKAKILLFVVILACAGAGLESGHPGWEPYTPTRIDWLRTTLQASLRHELTDETKYQLQIASLDAETILIYVRYLPTANREVINLSVESARQVIQITAKSYGWESWLKIKEDVKMESRHKN